MYPKHWEKANAEVKGLGLSDVSEALGEDAEEES